MPIKVNPAHGRIGTKSLLGGGELDTPIHASHRVLNSSNFTNCGRMSKPVPEISESRAGKFRNKTPKREETAIACKMPKKM